MPTALKYTLSFNNRAEVIELPVNPETISVSSGHTFEDIDVLGVGERTVIGSRKLREVTFSSFFPRDYHVSYCEYAPIPDPWVTVCTIEKWQRSGRPIRFMLEPRAVKETKGPYLNIAATIRSFQYRESSGHPGDLYYDLSLKEYVFTNFQETVSATEADEISETVSAKPRTYTVKAQDTLWLIAMRMLGDGDRWRELYAANQQVIGPNPNLIQPGQVLEVPV